MDYHHDRFEDFSLMVYKDESLFALLPANRKLMTLYSHQGLSYGGLLLKDDADFNSVLEGFKSVLQFLKTLSIEELQLKLVPKHYHQLPSDEMDYLLFILKAELVRRDITSTIDCSNRQKITSSNRKRGLKKAIKNELKVKEVNGFAEFWNHILIPNLKAKHNTKPVHTLEEIELLKAKFPKQIRQFNVYNNNDVVAGVTIFETKTVAHAQYISANEQKQELGSLDILFDQLINTTYKNKRYFDFGISNENQGKQINKGLLSWKESFGAQAMVHDHYTIKTKDVERLDAVLI
ncbi:MAG: GNAT family N-acetyltransferase [Gelidibacter sp.]|nr:GNAT family N-acetyltransferase [Gelidibacter sp.]